MTETSSKSVIASTKPAHSLSPELVQWLSALNVPDVEPILVDLGVDELNELPLVLKHGALSADILTSRGVRLAKALKLISAIEQVGVVFKQGRVYNNLVIVSFFLLFPVGHCFLHLLFLLKP